MRDNEKLVAIMDGDWKDASVAFMILPKDSCVQDLRDGNLRNLPGVPLDEYIVRIDQGRVASDDEIELYAVGIDPNREPVRTCRD